MKGGGNFPVLRLLHADSQLDRRFCNFLETRKRKRRSNDLKAFPSFLRQQTLRTNWMRSPECSTFAFAPRWVLSADVLLSLITRQFLTTYWAETAREEDDLFWHFVTVGSQIGLQYVEAFGVDVDGFAKCNCETYFNTKASVSVWSSRFFLALRGYNLKRRHRAPR